MTCHRWTEEEKAFLKSYIPGHRLKETQEAFFERFGQELSEMQLRTFSKYYRVLTGTTTAVPIGTERIKDGYVIVKTASGEWIRKHRQVWEQHYGKIPEGAIVAFKDNDRQNLDIRNLMLLTRAQNGYINLRGLQCLTGEEKTTAAIMADVSAARSKAKKKLQG